MLDIETTGRYWRNSRLLTLRIVSRPGPSALLCEKCYTADGEEDEYEILKLFSDDLKDRIFTFNGQAFDLPYLRNKLRAYLLPDPFPGRQHTDLLLRLRPLSRLLLLPSARLRDFTDFLCGSTECAGSECLQTARLLSMESYLTFLEGGYHAASAEIRDDFLVFTFTLEHTVPREVLYYDDPFRLALAGDTGSISVRISEDTIPFYYPDFTNYVYLPYEGYAVHKSLAPVIPASRRTKAVRETAFQKIDVSLFFENRQKKKERYFQYLSSALAFLKAPLALPETLGVS